MSNKQLVNEHFNQLCELQKKVDEFGEMFQNYVIPNLKLHSYFIEVIESLMIILPREDALFCLLSIVITELESLIADQTMKLS